MNLKLFKKIIKNLLKFVHIALSLVINALLWLEDKIIVLQLQARYQKALQAPIYRNSTAHEFIKDVGYIHREE